MKKRKSKFNNKKVSIGGIMFDSKAEAERYCQLHALHKAERISRLELQPSFSLHSKTGKEICKYKADFSYYQNDELVVEDVKGIRTAMFNLKKKWVEDEYKIKILLIKITKRSYVK